MSSLRPLGIAALAGLILVLFSGKARLWAAPYVCQSNPNNPVCHQPSQTSSTPTTTTTTTSSSQNQNNSTNNNNNSSGFNYVSSDPGCNTPEVQAILNGQDPFGGPPSGSCSATVTQLTARLSVYRKAQSCVADKKSVLQSTLANLNTDINTLKQDPNYTQLSTLRSQKATCQLSLQDKCCQIKNNPGGGGGGNGTDIGATCSGYVANCNTSGGTWVSYSYGCQSVSRFHGHIRGDDEGDGGGDGGTVCSGAVQDWKKLGGSCSPDCGGVCINNNNAINCYPYGGPTLQSLQNCVSCNGTFPKQSCHGRDCLDDSGETGSGIGGTMCSCGRIAFPGRSDGCDALCGPPGGHPCTLGADGNCVQSTTTPTTTQTTAENCEQGQHGRC